MPDFRDEDALRGLDLALQRQLRSPLRSDGVVLGKERYSAQELRRSDGRFLHLTQDALACLDGARERVARSECLDAFDKAVQREFAVYRTRPKDHLTAYYTPTLDVATGQDDTYRYPIYALPAKERLRQASRHDIDFNGVLKRHGLELFYARDRFDLYVLHVEGGGKVRIHSAAGVRTAYLSYAGDNGRELRPVENYMVAHGMLDRHDTSRHAQRNYLRRHPEATERVYSSSPLYVFFKVTDAPPLGSAEVPLTPGRSLASDPHYYPAKGLIAFVQARAPLRPSGTGSLEANPAGLPRRRMQRFFVDQDEGALIDGPARFDLYFGEGEEAEFLANNFLDHAAVYFLVLRKGSGE